MQPSWQFVSVASQPRMQLKTSRQPSVESHADASFGHWSSAQPKHADELVPPLPFEPPPSSPFSSSPLRASSKQAWAPRLASKVKDKTRYFSVSVMMIPREESRFDTTSHLF